MTYAIIGAAAVVLIVVGGFFVWQALRNARLRGEAEGIGKGAEAVEDAASKANANRDSVHSLDESERRRLLNRRD